MMTLAPSAEKVSSLDVTCGLAVHGIAEIGAELVQVDLVDAVADLLVRREQDLDRAVLDLWIADQEMRRIHDLGEPGLVVGAEQGGAVGGDDVVADLVGEYLGTRRRGSPAGVGREHDVAAAIILHDLRPDVPAGAVGRGVHVRAEADHRHRLVGVGRNRRVDIAAQDRDARLRCPSPAVRRPRRRPRSFCFSVEGVVGEIGSDWVSITA